MEHKMENLKDMKGHMEAMHQRMAEMESRIAKMEEKMGTKRMAKMGEAAKHYE